MADCPHELLNARHNNDSYTTAGTDGDRLILTQEKESDTRKRRSLAARPTSMLVEREDSHTSFLCIGCLLFAHTNSKSRSRRSYTAPARIAVE